MKSRFSWLGVGGLVLWASLGVAAEDVARLIAQAGDADAKISVPAIDRLGALGSEARPAVPALTQALARGDETVRWHAARALGALGGEAADADGALTKALDDPSPPVRAYAAYALGKIGRGVSTAAIDRLIEHAFDQDPLVRRSCLRALLAIDPPDEKALPVLLRVLEEGDADVIGPAVQTLAEEGKVAVPRLTRALKQDKAAYWACVTLAEIGPDAKEAVEPLREVLGHADPDLRMQALVALGEIGPASQPAVGDIAARLAQDEEPAVRYAAAYALGRIGLNDAARTALLSARDGSDAFLQMVSAWALARHNPKDLALVGRAVELIVAGLKSDDVHLRRAAAKSAVDFDVPLDTVAPLLIAALRDKDPQVVRDAIATLAELGPKALVQVDQILGNKELRAYGIQLIQRLGPQAKSAVPSLVACLEKPPQDEDDVRFLQEVQFALASIGPDAQDAVPALVRSLSAGQEELQASAAFALGRLGPKARAAVPELRKNLDNPSDIVRLATLSALMELQPGERRLAIVAAPLLLKALDSEHEVVRAEAARGLGRLGDLGRGALPRLKRLLQDASPLVREAAAESIKRLEN